MTDHAAPPRTFNMRGVLQTGDQPRGPENLSATPPAERNKLQHLSSSEAEISLEQWTCHGGQQD